MFLSRLEAISLDKMHTVAQLAGLQPFNPIVIIAIVTLGYLAYCVIDSYRAGLDHVPGPFFARFTDFDGLYRKWSVSLHGDWLTPLHEKYGDVVRIGPRSVSVADPAAIRTIYNTKSRLNKVFLAMFGSKSTKADR